MRNGVVVWFEDRKGFGFVRDAATGEELYVDYHDILRDGFKTLNVGEAVIFESKTGDGGLKATRVRPVADAST